MVDRSAYCPHRWAGADRPPSSGESSRVASMPEVHQSLAGVSLKPRSTTPEETLALQQR